MIPLLIWDAESITPATNINPRSQVLLGGFLYSRQSTNMRIEPRNGGCRLHWCGCKNPEMLQNGRKYRD